MILIVFFFVVWLSVIFNQVLVIWPLQALQIVHLPPLLGLAVLLAIFAWIFGD